MKMLFNSNAIYKQIAQYGVNSLRPFIEDGKKYIINMAGEQIEMQSQNAGALPIDSWKKLDADIASVIRTDLTVFSDIQNVGTVDLGSMEDALGTFLYINQMVSDSGAANLSMSGKAVIGNDEPLYKEEALPLPMINSDFRMDVRSMHASGRGAYGNGSNVRIDTTEAQNEARKFSEKLEDLAIVGGGTFSYAGHSIYGITTSPNRITDTFAASWALTATAGKTILEDIRDGLNQLFIEGFGGNKTIMLYIPKEYAVAMTRPYSDTYDAKSIGDVIRNTFPQIIDIKTAFRLTANTICLVEMRPRTCKIVNGFAPTPISWMTPDGLEFNWKLLGLQIPKFYSDYNAKNGIYHATLAV